MSAEGCERNVLSTRHGNETVGSIQLPYTIQLKSAWAKVDRAKMHIDDLDDAIGKQYNGINPISLRRTFEPDQGVIMVRIDSVVDVPDNWGLIVGDAVHNLRCALDHLAWELALKYFDGVEPTDRRIIKQIQFPVVVDKNLWESHINRKYMLPSDADKVEQFQPFNLGPISRSKGAIHPFEAFCGFAGVSNVDKHRRIHLAYMIPQLVSFAGLDSYMFHDCEPILNDSGVATIDIGFAKPPTNPGDEVARVAVRPTGPSPDVDFEMRMEGYVAIRERWNVIEALDTFANGVEMVLRDFD